MRALVALVALVCIGCGSVPTGNDDVDELVNGLCAEHGSLCVGTSTKRDLGLDELADAVYWGRFNYGEIALPGSNLRYGVVCYDDELCADDLEACAAVVLHEIGHQKRGSDQTDADCWAAQHATESQLAALQELVCSFNEPGRCDALLECSP